MLCFVLFVVALIFVWALFIGFRGVSTDRVTWKDVRSVWPTSGPLGRIGILLAYIADLMWRAGKWPAFAAVAVSALSVPATACGIEVHPIVELARELRQAFESFLEYLQSENGLMQPPETSPGSESGPR